MISLTKFAIRRPVTVTMFFIGITLLGMISWRMLPVQLFPNLIYPKVFLALIMPGASPEKIEKELVIPAEGEISKLKDIEEIESRCNPSSAMITISYDYSTNMKYAFLKLQQRVNAFMKTMPEGSRARLERFDTSDFTSFLMDVSIEGETSEEALKTVSEKIIKPRIEQVDGIVFAGVDGGKEEEVEVLINEDRATAMRLKPGTIVQAIDDFNKKKEYLGKVYSDQYMYFVSLSGQAAFLSEIENIIVDKVNKIRLSDVATVTRKQKEKLQVYRINGKSTVGMFIQKDDQSNMLRVSERVKSTIEELNTELEGQGINIKINFNQASYMKKAIDKVKKLAVVGMFLALLVLLYFLRNVKVVSVLVIAIPISVIVTFNLMYYWNVSVNILSLCGIAFAIGLLVDNGIVVLENIYRHYERGKDIVSACITGTGEVSRAITASTLTTVVVFLPTIFVKSEVRLILRELSLSVIFPLLVSLLVALTLIPMLTARFLTHNEKAFSDRGRKLEFGRLLERYSVLLKAIIRNVRRTLVALFIVFILVLLFVPPFLLSREEASENESFEVYVDTVKGTPFEATDNIVREVEKLVKDIDDIKDIRSRVRENEAMVTVDFLEKNKREKELNLPVTKNELKKKMDLIPGGMKEYERAGTGTSSVRRGGGGGGNQDGGGLFGIGNEPEKVIIRGFDLDKLNSLSDYVVSQLKDMEEIDYARTDLRDGEPEIRIQGDERNLALHNLTMTNLMRLIWYARREGNESQTKFKFMDEELDIVTRFGKKNKSGIDNLKRMTIPAPGIGNVPLERLSKVTMDIGPRTIIRHNQEREIQVTYQFKGNVLSYKPQLEAMRNEVDRIVRNINVPKGFSLEVIHEKDTDKTFYWIIGIAVLLIFMILASIFESMSAPFTILITVPFATIGALLWLLISGSALSVMGWLGLLILLGIVVNNGILFIDYTNYLRFRQGFRRERAILTAGKARVRPIMMTAATTVFGLTPLMFKTGEMGEIWPPFANAVVGGLVCATVLTPLCIPAAYIGLDEIVAGFKKMKKGWKAMVLLSNSAYVYYIYVVLNSIVWKIFFCVAGIIMINWLLWKLFNFSKEKKKTVFEEEDLKIYIQNLKKIYNGPGRFRKDWMKRLRKDYFRLLKKLKIKSDLNIKERLTWKIPVFGFIFYLNYYFSNWFAVVCIAVLSYHAIRNLWKELKLILDHRRKKELKKTSRIRCFLGGTIRKLIPPAFLYYIYFRWGKASAVLIIAYLIWIFQRYAKSVSMKIRSGDIDPDDVRGRFRRSRRMMYRLIRWLPFYGAKKIEVRALNGVNLTITKGMFGLLGPNGAGKTTLMRLICTIFDETRGSIFINNDKLKDNRDKIQSVLGYLPQDFGVYESFTGFQYLTFQAILNNHWDTGKREELIERILNQVGLWDRRNSKIKTYSGGMKQRIGIAQTLLRLPKIIVVDEPTAGLDPKERIRFRNLLSEMSKTRIVIFSTHIIEDISTSCNDLAVLYNGEVVFNNHPRELRKTAEGHVWESIIKEDEFSEYNKKLKIVSHQKWKEGIRIRYIGDSKPEDLEAEEVNPSLEDAYLLLLSKFNGKDKNVEAENTADKEENPAGS